MVNIVLLGKHHYDPNLLHMTEDGFVLKTVEVQLFQAAAPMLVHKMFCAAANRESEFQYMPGAQPRLGDHMPIWFDLDLHHIEQVQRMMPEYLRAEADIGTDWSGGGRKYRVLSVALMHCVAWLALFSAQGQSRTVRYIAS